MPRNAPKRLVVSGQTFVRVGSEASETALVKVTDLLKGLDCTIQEDTEQLSNGPVIVVVVPGGEGVTRAVRKKLPTMIGKVPVRVKSAPEASDPQPSDYRRQHHPDSVVNQTIRGNR